MKAIRKLKWIFLALVLIGLKGNEVFAQAEDGPISGYTDVVYLNLDAGNVTITPSTYTGYRWNGNTAYKVTGSASSSTLYYIYQAKPNTSWGPNNLPQYPPVTTTSGATGSNALNIVNNTDVMAVINGWNAKVQANNAAQSNNNYKRYSTDHWININCHSRINICLDNIWSTRQSQSEDRTDGGLAFYPSDNNQSKYIRLNVYLKGDSRMGNVHYMTSYEDDNGNLRNYTNSHIIFRSADGNGAITGTLTVADIDPSQTHTFTLPNTDPNATHYTIHVPANHYNAVIGSNDNNDMQNAVGIDFKGGTIFAGAVFDDNCTAIGGGGNGVGTVTIDGGQITAVTSSTGTAIGGGIGWIALGGEGHVTINGGKVYAYNHGVAYIYDDHLRYVPATAIGGGSSFKVRCNPCTVTINGGEVYAQSVGGVTIGGGGSGLQSAGDGTVTITGGTVTAKSIPGTVTSSQMPAGQQTISVPAGAAIGGGTGGLGTAYGGSKAYGGNATVNISGGTLYAGSVGGGATNDPQGKIGSATVNISGGTSQAQFIMAAGSTTHCSYTQTNGIVQNSNTSSTEFILLKPDGGAVWMDDPLGEASISGGTIRNCSANNGGAIYMTGGSFEISGGTVGGSSITDGNKATNYGGGVYMGGGTFEMRGGNIQYNKATNQSGGGIYIGTGGTVAIYGGNIEGNQALNGNGGGFFVNPGASVTTTINSNNANTSITGNQAKYGGGAYVNSGTLSVASTNNKTTTIQGNSVSEAGGGFYVASGAINATNVICSENNASKKGGGLYVAGGGNNTITGGTIASNTAGTDGGGCYVNGKLTIKQGAQLYSNIATNNGGAVYVTGGDFSLLNCTVGGSAAHGNQATTKYGGGIYVDGTSTVLVTGGEVSYNKAVANNGRGGGLYVNASSTDPITFNGGVKINYNEAYDGGGAYVAQGNLLLDGIGVEVSHNTATRRGGGLYTSTGANAGTVTLNGIKMSENTAQTGDGGGLYVGKGSIYVNGTEVLSNHANSGKGGGIYANETGCFVEIQKYTYSGKTEKQSELSGNTANHGGALYVNNGEVTIKDSSVLDTNTATGNGGGIYIGGGGISMSGGVIGGDDASDANSAVMGGGIYSADGSITVTGGNIAYNEADYGGGIYTTGGDVHFSDGYIQYNQASEQGGGIYIGETGILYLQGSAQLVSNHVPADHDGGGVYMNGTLNVGQNADDPAGTHSLLAHDNYAGTTESYTLNNIFLPNENKYITLLSDISGVNPETGTYYTRLGFSVTRGFCPVVYTDITGANAPHEAWLQSLMGSSTTLTGAIFDDANKYPALHLPEDHGPILAKYIWLWGCWTTEVDEDPGTENFTFDSDSTIHIKTNEGLAWFSSYVNGLNGCSAHHNANAVLENDINMEGFLWVPIGAVTGAVVDPMTHQTVFTDGGYYSGTFDGQGHVIEGLQCFYLNAIPKIGLFGYLNDATVKNTFVNDYWYMSTYTDETYYLGGIAGIAEGNTVLSNSEARGQMETTVCATNSYMGGLVGKAMEGATIHSSMAMPTMSGAATYVGGLVGGLASANNTLKNSYAYPMFGTTTNNVGGLVGENNGIVENCYVRLQADSQTDKLGWFAATNNGTIQFCYAPVSDELPYIKSGDDPIGHGTYGATTLVDGNKYGYMHQDQQIVLAPDQTNDTVVNGFMGNDGELTGLLATLNKWVKNNEGYSKWTRTMASPINDDYPILEFDDFLAASSEDNIFITYRDNLNDMIDLVNDNSDGGSIYLYDNHEDLVSSNTAENVRVYIAPDASILQAEGNTLNARVGVVFDNDADNDLGGANYDWHMFSTPLSNAPLGITYNDSETHYYGYEIPETNIDVEAECYFPTNTPFNSFDYYCYSEKYYHWINFKRHTNDHWHQDEPHDQIFYTNEETLFPGKGYMMAVDQPTMLMSDGILNNDTVGANVTYTSSLGGYAAVMRGVNLVGNPYQSYLDATAFLEANNLNTYYILDANANGYIAYTKGGSSDHIVNPSPSVVDYNVIAPACLHPHQGFFVRVAEGTTGVNFTNEMRTFAETTFRGNTVNYPMVNMICTDANGYNDFATIELDRPDMGGGEKIKGLRTGDASIWFSMEGNDWQIAFAPEGTTSAPLRFEAYADGVYTMRWKTANGDFSYLHLIDNMTGSDVDCLTTGEYRFEATTHDYTSRFNVVFEFTGVEENEEGTTSNFAFMTGDELVVNGEGVLQVFDINGRMLKSVEVYGTQSTVSLPEAANGVYMLRLVNNNQVRTQKMVINK